MSGSLNARVRIVDIAREAGVSAAVVTKVLSGSSGTIRVGREKAELVRKIAQHLNYQPNIIARALVGGKSKIIGVYIDSLAPGTYFRTLAGIEHYLSKEGYRMMIAESHDDMGKITDAYNTFIQYGVDGVILISHDYPQFAEDVQKRLVNLEKAVFVGAPLIGNAVHVNIDFAGGAEIAVRHLIERGKRRLGIMISDEGTAALRLRAEGFRNATEQAGTKIECALIHTFHSLPVAEYVLDTFENFIRPNRIDGLIAANDLNAAYMQRMLVSHGLRVPQDVALIGLDNMDFSAALSPALTTIDENCNQTAQHAVDLLMHLLNGTLDWTQPTPIVTPTLIVREST